MTAVVPERDHRVIIPHEYLSDLNKTAMCALAMGAPLGLVRHVTFLLNYINAWLGQAKDSAEEAEKAAEAVFGRAPGRFRRRISRWLGSGRMPRHVLLALLFVPLVVPLVVVLPWQFAVSLARSAWDMLKRGVHGVPPLITAVVVVFVTSDAWHILGSGFTIRFAVVVAVFLVAGLLFLIRGNCWLDIDAEHAEAARLLDDIGPSLPAGFHAFTRCGIKAAPMVRPSGRRAVRIYLSYSALAAAALIIAAGFVASALIVIGAILISRNETMTMAQSAYVYQSFPGGLVITKELLSLSFSLGAFAAFFLVAAQRPEDRDAFMKNVLAPYRQALLVYSVYCRAHDRAPELTRVFLRVRPLQPAAERLSRTARALRSPLR